MEFNAFIVPITLILVQLVKLSGWVPNRFLPHVSVLLGAAFGLAYGSYYSQDLFVHIFTGVLYGASAAGIYDAGKSALTPKEG